MAPLHDGKPEVPQPQSGADEKDGQIRDYTFWLTVFTGALVVATMVLAVPSICMARTARETAEKQLRAYVVVKGVTVELVKDHNTSQVTGLTCRVAFLNAGQTPAYDFEPSWTAERREYQMEPRFAPVTLRAHRSTAILGPRVEHPEGLGTGMNLTDNEVAALRRNDKAVYIWGQVRYRDIFNKTRHTCFAFQWPRIVSKIEDPHATACEHGNGAD